MIIKDKAGNILGVKKRGVVKIGGLKIPIYLAKDITRDGLSDGRVLGVARYDEKDVFVRECLGTEMRKLVLIHEITHQIDDLQGTGLSETQVDGISKGIYDFLVNNPKWMDLVK